MVSETTCVWASVEDIFHDSHPFVARFITTTLKEALIRFQIAVEFFLQVLMTDFNSFRGGKYKVVRSLVSGESHESYSLVSLVS